MTAHLRCRTCNTGLQSRDEISKKQCNSCSKKKNVGNGIGAIALVLTGAAIGFIGGYITKWWEASEKTDIHSSTNTTSDLNIDEISDEDTIAMCTICYENIVSIALNPCGHTICAQCDTELQSTITCPMCREHIVRKQAIFFN